MKARLEGCFIVFAISVLALVLSGCNTESEEAAKAAQPGSAAVTTPSVSGTATPNPHGLKFSAPPGWISETPSSSMRQAQYRLPKAKGDSEDAELAVFYFGSGGGSAQDNINRWIGQFQAPGGAAANGTVTHREVHGMAVSMVDVSGTYMSASGPMMSTTSPKPGFRMLAAVVETPAGPWFFKMTGPAKTVANWTQSFQSFIDTVQ